MAYFDGIDDQPLTPDQEAENRRRMLGMLASGRTSVLGNKPLEPSPIMNASQPAVPAPKTTSLAPPSLDPSFTPKPPLLGAASQPARPNVMPQRTDFPERKLPTWEKVLGVAAAPFVPAVTGAILGGPRREAERQYNAATTDWERGQTDAYRAAQTANLQSEAEARRNPKPEKPENLQQVYADAVTDAQNRGVDPAKDLKVQQIADAITSLQKQTPPKPDTATQEDQRYEGIKTSQTLKKPVSPEDAAWAQSYEKRKTLAPFATAVAQAPQKGTERSDRSFQYNNTAIDKIATPVDQINQRMGRLMDTLNQNSPQADALVAPELLSVMSGGQGSGLRMNEAEIARIVGGRSKWESLKASINKWSLDPKAALSITPEQRQEIRALSKTVQDKLISKGKIIDDSRNSLIDSDDPKEHRRIVSDMKKRLDAIDAGESEGGPIEIERGPDGKLRLKNARQ